MIERLQSEAREILKRGLDIVVASLALVACLPALALVSLAVLVVLGRPVLFRQERPGLGGIPFGLRKFRTMLDLRDANGQLLPDKDRLSSLGRFLRRTSLDELPQLWNVLVGDMSIVGPRPLLMEYLERYTPDQARRQAIRPGITGWAQVNGRNALSWEEKFKLDVWYVDHQSFWLDLKILALTVWRVIAGSGVSAKGEATMPEFMGTEAKQEAKP